MKVIQIGNGNVAKMHRDVFPKNVETIGVVEINPNKQRLAEEAGLEVFPNIDAVPSALMADVDFWDICVPDEGHFPLMKKLLEMGFEEILVEKPICQPSQISAMKKLLEKFAGARICVEETYISSAVAEIVRRQSEKRGLTRPKIWMEQSKNRIQDIINGRFIDQELGVFALEVPHSLTAIAATGKKRLPAEISDVSLEDMEIRYGEILPRQGKGRIVYTTEDGCEATILSATNGEVLRPLPEIDAPTAIPFGSPVRYRVLVLEQGKNKIIGQFEPIPGWPRFVGRILVYESGVLQEKIEVKDNPMNRHIAKAIRYFQREEKNPAPPLEALSIVSFLNEAMKKLN